MAIKACVADEKSQKERVFGLCAGDPGVGKTTQMTKFPIAQTLGVSAEKGMLSIKGSGIRYLQIDTYKDLIQILETDIHKPEYKWVQFLIIDSLSEIYDLLKSEAKDKFTPAQNYAKNDEIDDLLFYAIRLARDLTNINVWFTAHTKTVKDGLAIEESLSFDGKTPVKIARQFDVVVHMKDVDFNGVMHRCFVTNPRLSKVAKARVSPFLGITLGDYEQPDLYLLSQKLHGKK